MTNVVELLRLLLQPVFPGYMLDSKTEGVIRWKTILTQRSRGEIPDECFISRSGSKHLLVVRDSFLAWWASTVRPANTVADPTPRGRAGRRRHDAGRTG